MKQIAHEAMLDGQQVMREMVVELRKLRIAVETLQKLDKADE
jgi:hypothetical protein